MVRSIVVAARLLVALAVAAAPLACSSGVTAPQREPLSKTPSVRADMVEAKLQNGFLDVSLLLPRGFRGPRPVVINPIVPDAMLLARGIGVARLRSNWDMIAAALPFAAAAGAPVPKPKPAVPRGKSAAKVAQRPTRAAETPMVGRWLLAAPRPGIVGQSYFALLAHDAESSIPRVIDFLQTVPQVDPDRIAISGSSTSGFTALQALAAEPRLAAGAIRAACGDYHAFLRYSTLALANEPRWLPGGRLVLDPQYDVRIRAIEPIGQAQRFPPRPLLLMAGGEDRAIPSECMRPTVTRFEEAYQHAGAPERFRFIEYAGQGHSLGPETERETLDWWDRWLR